MFHVKHGDAVREGVDLEPVASGDAIQISYRTNEPAYLAVLGVDGAKQVSTYHPRDHERAVRAAVGRVESLRESIVLDSTPGTETLFALFCVEPIVLAPIVSALEQAPDTEPRADGCAVERVRVVKAAP